MNVHKNVVDLRTDPFQEGGNDGRRPKQGLIIRSMTKHIEAQEESKTPTDIKMLTTLSFSEKL